MSKREIKINYEELCELELTPNQYALAYFIHNKDKEAYSKLRTFYSMEDIFKDDLHRLILKGYLTTNNKEDKYTFNFDKSVISGIFKEESKEEISWDEFVNSFRESFPAGVQSGSFYVKSSIRDIDSKLKKFVKEYKYPKELILKAVNRYVDNSSKDGYKYMKLAHYFISKNNESALASYCDAIEQEKEGGGAVPSIFLDNI